jgi:hypothetical protein
MSSNDSYPTQRTDPNAWGTDPCAPKNPPRPRVFKPAELFKIVRAPPVETKGTGSFLGKLMGKDEKWIVWYFGRHVLEEYDEMPEDATEEKDRLAVLFLLDGKGYLRQQKTSWGLDYNKNHLNLTVEGWRYRKSVEEAAAIHVGEGFEFKRDEEKLKQTLVGVWEIDGGQCFQDAMYQC